MSQEFWSQYAKSTQQVGKGKVTLKEANNEFEPFRDEFSLKRILLIICDIDHHVLRVEFLIGKVED